MSWPIRGVDIELPGVRRRPDLRRRVLTNKECQSLGKLVSLEEEEEVLLRFSVKEAIYKAAHPLLRRPLGFKDVSATNPKGCFQEGLGYAGHFRPD